MKFFLLCCGGALLRRDAETKMIGELLIAGGIIEIVKGQK